MDSTITKYPYEFARFVDAKGKKYIEYRIWNIDTQKLERMRDYRINSFANKGDFRIRIDLFINEIDKLLISGAYKGSTDSESDELIESKKPKAPLKIAKAFEKTLELKCATLRYRSGQAYSCCWRLLKRFWEREKPGLLNRPIETLANKDFVDFFTFLKLEAPSKFKPGQVGHSNASVNSQRILIKSMLNEMVASCILEKNPLVNTKKLPVNPVKNVAFNDAQAKTIIELLKSKEQYRQHLYFYYFIFYSFARPNELRKMKIKDINLEQRTGFVSADIAKNRIPRNFQILKPLLNVIEEMNLKAYSQDFYIFGQNGVPGPKHFSRTKFYVIFRQIFESLGLPREYTLYSTKHFGITKHFLAGFDLRWIQDQAGFSSLEMILKYMRSLGLSANRNKLPDAPEIIFEPSIEK
jgi:integrase